MIFSNASAMGDSPHFVCMDANTTASTSEALAEVLATGEWYDVADLYADENGPMPTYCNDPEWGGDRQAGATTPDHIYVNKAGKELIVGFQLRYDLQVTKHVGLEVTIATDVAESKHETINSPPPFPIPSGGDCPPKEAIEAKINELWNEFWPKFKQSYESAKETNAQPNGEKDDFAECWRLHAKMCEAYLRWRTGAAPGFQGGRCCPPSFQSSNVKRRGAALNKDPAQVDLTNDSRINAMTKIGNQLGEVIVNCEHDDIQRRMQAFGAWGKLMPKNLDKWLSSRPGHFSKSTDYSALCRRTLPSAHVAKCMKEDIDHDIKVLKIHLRATRTRKWKQEIRKSRYKGGKQIYRWLKGPPQPPIASIRCKPPPGYCGEEKVVNQMDQVFDGLKSFWATIWGQEGKLDYKKFKQRYGAYIKKHPCEVPELTAFMLFDAVHRTNVNRAVACDGWRVAELRLLPEELFDWPATLLAEHERGAPWPKCLAVGMVTCLAKVDKNEENTESLQQVAPYAEETRPITNLALWVSLWEKVRYEQRASWRYSWMHPSMHGTCRNVKHVSWKLAMTIERLHNSAEKFSGASIDRKKFFDLLQQDIVNPLLKDLGMPECIVRAIQNFYSVLECRFKIGTSVSDAWSRIMGFVQGSSYSIEGALAIMHIWTCAVESESGAIPSSYIDDSNFISHGDGQSQKTAKAWQITREFDQFAGTVCHVGKTKFYADSTESEADLRKACKDNVKCVNCFLLVGDEVTVRGKGGGPASRKRQRENAALTSGKRVALIPGPMEVRAMPLTGGVIPKFVYGEDQCPATKKAIQDMRVVSMNALLPNNRQYSSPAITLSLCVKGHRGDVKQATAYHPLEVAASMLRELPFGVPQSADTVLNCGRTDFVQAFHARRRAKQEGKGLATGPISNIAAILEKIGIEWREPNRLVRVASGRCDLAWWGDDPAWWLHEVRQEIREWAIRTDEQLSKREDLQGLENGFDYEATVAILKRPKKKKRAKKKRTELIDTTHVVNGQGATPAPSGEQITNDTQNGNALKNREDEQRGLSRRDAATMRIIWSGGTHYGQRLAKMHKNESLRACPFCDAEVIEDDIHMWWECPCWAKEREKLYELTSEEERKSWPPCTRRCGIWVGQFRKQKNEAQKKLAEHVRENSAAPEPRLPEGSKCTRLLGDVLYVHKGKVVVAGDGACPHQATAQEMRRSAMCVHYGKDHPANCEEPICDMNQGAQTAEVAAAVKWSQWAWCPTTFLTDSQYVYGVIRRILEGGGNFLKLKNHCNLWKTFSRNVNRKGKEMFDVIKVFSHVPWEEIKDKDPDTIEKWKRNDQADKGAVRAAEKFVLTDPWYDAVEREKKIAATLQVMMLNIVNAKRRYVEHVGWRELDKRSKVKRDKMVTKGKWTSNGNGRDMVDAASVDPCGAVREVGPAHDDQHGGHEQGDVDPETRDPAPIDAHPEEDELDHLMHNHSNAPNQGGDPWDDEYDPWGAGGLDYDGSPELVQTTARGSNEISEERAADPAEAEAIDNAEGADLPNQLQTFEDYWASRQAIWPDYDWTNATAVDNAHTHFEPVIPAGLAATTWDHTQIQFVSALWYWRRVKWVTNMPADDLCQDTTWVELALDFQASTGVNLAPEGEDDDEHSVIKKAERFRKMTIKLAKVCKSRIGPFAKGDDVSKSYIAKSLFVGNMHASHGVRGRAIFVSRDTLKQVLKIFLTLDRPRVRRHMTDGSCLNFPVTPVTAPPMWELHRSGIPLLSLVDDLPSVDDSRPSVDNSPELVAGGSATSHVSQSKNLRDTLMRVTWTDEEQNIIQNAKGRTQAPTKRMLIHNRTAVSRGLHLIAAVQSEDGILLERIACGNAGCTASCSRNGLCRFRTTTCPALKRHSQAPADAGHSG